MSARSRSGYDVVIVGSGPNGLAAGIALAQHGRSVLVIEGSSEIGGGMRTQGLTLPGFVHDVCSAVHPLGAGSPFLRTLPLHEYGLEWIDPPIPVAHPLDGGTAAALHRDLETTATYLGKDGNPYRQLMAPLASRWQELVAAFLGPLRRPRHPFLMARFAARAVTPASVLAKAVFKGEPARALLAGLAAHAIQPLEHLGTAAFAVMLAMLGHGVGWPFPRGGSARLAAALAAHLRSLGGEIVTGQMIGSLRELPSSRAVVLDLAPNGLLNIAGEQLPTGYRRQLERYRYGPGVFKLDLALDGPVPWTAEACRRAGTVHLGGALREIAAAEREVWQGRHPERPYVLVAQQSLFDGTRAPPGKHTLWAYCHVPNGSTVDMTERVLSQLERFAPGLRDRVLASNAMSAADFERYNANFVGGDINAGVQNLRQQFTRPAIRLDPYSTPLARVFLCSAATPPGGGVHGMCGYFAAQSVLREAFG